MSHEPAYDPVATLYERAFHDIRVRRAEYAWLSAALDRSVRRPRVLDVGTGNGALLSALAPRLGPSVGVDIASGMLAQAERRARLHDNLRFQAISGPTLPFADGSFDVVVSFLSFRYLDWPRVWPEIRRVLVSGGRFVMVDLVRERARARDAAHVLGSTLRHTRTRFVQPRFVRDLRALTEHPDWRAMLQRHPMRPLSEYRAFFREQLPQARFCDLDVLPSRRVVGLDSGALPHAEHQATPAARARP